jgi:iron complex transport system substrate-binding protein
MRVVDVRGRTFDFNQPPRRVVSLVPSLTETLFDLGAGDDVIGVTDFCIFPEDLDRPRVGGTKNPRVDAIRALEPDLVHMNLEENLARHAEEIEKFAPVFVTEPKTVDDVEQLFIVLGAIHDCDPSGLCAALQRERDPSPGLRPPSPRAAGRGDFAPTASPLAPLAGRGDFAPTVSPLAPLAGRGDGGEGFTFACAIWKKPWMWCGGDTYVSNLIECAGGTNVLRDQARYPSVDVNEIRADVIFLPDEPYVFTNEDAARIKHAKVIGPFPGHLVTWHGSRTILGLRFLRELSLGSPIHAPE